MFKEVFSQLLILKSTKTNKYTVKGIYLKGLRNTETKINILCTMLFFIVSDKTAWFICRDKSNMLQSTGNRASAWKTSILTRVDEVFS